MEISKVLVMRVEMENKRSRDRHLEREGFKMTEDLLKIINHYGVKHQQRKIAEEEFELNEAITQREYPAIAKDKKPYVLAEFEKSHIIEEIADVTVLLRQFQYYYGIEDSQIESVLKYKVERQLKRIGEKE